MIALICLLAASGHDAALVVGRAATIAGFMAFVVAVACLAVVAGGDGGDEPGSDDDGPGWSPPEPRRPPPEPHVSWPDFEREFAEHVEALGARDKVRSG